MAATLPRSLHFPLSPLHQSSKHSHQPHHLQTHKPFFIPFKPAPLSFSSTHPIDRPLILTRATENGAQTDNDAGTPEKAAAEGDQLSEVGAEIKKAMQERELARSGTETFFSGVGEEIGLIEWPKFGKVVGATGVVLAVIAGSSVVLLTLNAVLAEISDQVFVGKGIQDFFRR